MNMYHQNKNVSQCKYYIWSNITVLHFNLTCILSWTHDLAVESTWKMLYQYSKKTTCPCLVWFFNAYPLPSLPLDPSPVSPVARVIAPSSVRMTDARDWTGSPGAGCSWMEERRMLVVHRVLGQQDLHSWLDLWTSQTRI